MMGKIEVRRWAMLNRNSNEEVYWDVFVDGKFHHRLGRRRDAVAVAERLRERQVEEAAALNEDIRS